MNKLQIFSNDQFGTIRASLKDGEPLFVAADVCKALDIDRSQTRRLDDDEKGVCLTQTLGGEQELTAVTESGLYSLVLGSRKPEAKAFKGGKNICTATYLAD
jgi:anti-repressor protein